jgi:hypothetical protein
MPISLSLILIQFMSNGPQLPTICATTRLDFQHRLTSSIEMPLVLIYQITDSTFCMDDCKTYLLILRQLISSYCWEPQALTMNEMKQDELKLALTFFHTIE